MSESEPDKKEEKEPLKCGAHCFRCGVELILNGVYWECPEHGRNWLPSSFRY